MWTFTFSVAPSGQQSSLLCPFPNFEPKSELWSLNWSEYANLTCRELAWLLLSMGGRGKCVNSIFPSFRPLRVYLFLLAFRWVLFRREGLNRRLGLNKFSSEFGTVNIWVHATHAFKSICIKIHPIQYMYILIHENNISSFCISTCSSSLLPSMRGSRKSYLRTHFLFWILIL